MCGARRAAAQGLHLGSSRGIDLDWWDPEQGLKANPNLGASGLFVPGAPLPPPPPPQLHAGV